MAELCDELSTALNNLIMTQKNMSDMDGLVEIDSLLRVAASQLRVSLLYYELNTSESDLYSN